MTQKLVQIFEFYYSEKFKFDFTILFYYKGLKFLCDYLYQFNQKE